MIADENGVGKGKLEGMEMDDKIFWISILVGVIGAVSILCIVAFGWYLFSHSMKIHSRKYPGLFLEVLFHEFRSVHERTTLL